MNQLQKEHRAKNQARGMDAIREQMAAIANSSEGKTQAVEIESYQAIRETLSPATLDILIEMKHAGSPGITNKGLAVITRYSENTVKAAVAKLRRLDAVEVTGFACDRPVRNRICREGVNILQAR